MAINKLTGLEDNTKPLNKNLTKDLTKLDISTATVPLTKTYVDKTNIDINKYQEEKESSSVGFTLTPDSYIKNQDKIQEFKQEQEVLLNDYKAYNQGLGEKVSNGIVKFGGRVYTSVAGATVGTLYGLYSWAKDGEFKSFYDNEFQQSLDGINDYLAEEYKHYYTSSKDDWEIGNFIFDKVFDGLGFATGAVLSSVIGGSVTGAITKSFRLTNALKLKAVNKLLETTDKVTDLGKFNQLTSQINKLNRIDQFSKLPQSMTALVTGAVYESGVEARHGYNETRELLIDAYKQTHEGRTPIDSDLDEINKLAGETANGIFAANMAIVGGGNILQFGKHIGLDYKDFTKMFKPNVAKEFIDETGKQAFKKTGSKALRGTTAVVKNAVVESQEEMLQSVISGTGKDYTLTKYNNNGKADLSDLLDSSIKSFKKTYSSSEGWEEGLIGAIVGSMGVVAPRSRTDEEGNKRLPITLAGGIYESIKDFKQSEIKRDKLINNLNNKGSIISLNEGIKNHIRDSRLEKIKDSSIETNNELAYKNAQDDQFHGFVTSRIEAGMIKSVYKDLSELSSKPLSDFKQAFGIPEDYEYSEMDKNKQIDSFERRAKSIQKSTEFIDRVYKGNNPEVRESLIYNQSMANRLEERKTTLSNAILESTGGTSIALNVFDEQGKRISKNKIFENVPKEHQYKKIEYEKLYDDYIFLSNRQNKMYDELYELLDPKGNSQTEEELNKATKQREQEFELEKAKKDKIKKQKAAEQQAEKIRKQKLDKNKEKEVISNLFKSLNDSDINDGTPIQMSEEDINTVIKNINNLNNKEEFDNFIKQLNGNLKSLPLAIQDAIVKKAEKYADELVELSKQEIDPYNASGEVKVDEVVKNDIKNKINEGEEINTEPIDATKTEAFEQETSYSNAGEKTTSIENEEVRKNGETIFSIEGRLLDAHNTLATSTRLFEERESGKITQLNEINERANLDVLSSELLQKGDKVSIHLYQGQFLDVYTTDGKPNGQIENEFGINQIMEVRDSNDITIGYIHQEGYIRSDRVYEYIGDENNLDRNKELLKANRKKVFDHINKTGQPFITIILDKSSGTVMTTARFSPLSEVIEKDIRPQLLVVKEDGLYLGGNHIKDTDLNSLVFKDFKEDFYQKYKGATMIALPGANGRYLLKFVKNPTLNEKPHIKKLINEVITAYLNNDVEFIQSLNIDFNPEKISEYINNFIFATNKIESNHRLTFFTDEYNQPAIRFRDLEGNSLLVKLKDGSLTNIKQLQERLDAYTIAINLKKYTENPIILTRDSNNQLQKIKYVDFLKENLNVNFMSTVIRGGSERVYVANPIIALDFDNNIQISPNPQTKSTTEDITKEEEFINVFDVSNQSSSQVEADISTTKQKPNSIKNSSLGKTIINKKGVSLQLNTDKVSIEEAEKRKKDCL